MCSSLIFGTDTFSLQTQEVPNGSGEPQKLALADSLRLAVFFLENDKVKEAQYVSPVGVRQGI